VMHTFPLVKAEEKETDAVLAAPPLVTVAPPGTVQL